MDDNSKKMATDDIALFGLGALICWTLTVIEFGWLRLLGALLFTFIVYIRVQHIRHGFEGDDNG